MPELLAILLLLTATRSPFPARAELSYVDSWTMGEHLIPEVKRFLDFMLSPAGQPIVARRFVSIR
jgi:hypothetical protein